MSVESLHPTEKKVTAFVDIFVDTTQVDDTVKNLCLLEAIEEVYEVTGEFDVVTVVCAKNIESFRDILKNKIMRVPGVKSVVSSIVLNASKGARADRSYIENGEQ